MIVIDQNLILGPSEASLPSGTPWIGYRTIAGALNTFSTTAASGFPISNLTNPLTHLKWKGANNTQEEYIVIAGSGSDPIDYVAFARHNFGSRGIAVTVERYLSNSQIKVLLPFHGTDGSVTVLDYGVARVWTANGNAQIDTASSQFGGSSGLMDGNGDWFSTPDAADLNLGSGDWTIRTWFRADDAGGAVKHFAGQYTGVNATSAWLLQKSGAGAWQLQVFVGGSAFVINGTTNFTNALNPGWHHLEVVRTGNTLKMFLDGVQEGGNVAIAGTVNDGAIGLGVGALNNSDPGVNGWKGWVDDFEIRVGTALHTANFTPPTRQTSELVNEIILPNDSPVIFRFTPEVLTNVIVRLKPGSAPPEAAVMYVGKLLVMERGIKIDVDHVPVPYGRRRKDVVGVSESGNYLGRVMTQQHRETKAEFAHITPDWYRTYLDPFFALIGVRPFFWAWNPGEYPLEDGFMWMVNQPEPATSPVTRRVAVVMEMWGVT